MKTQDYTLASGRTFAYRQQPLSENTTDALHCVIGMVTESGELADAFKKHIYYGKELDIINVAEEIGDTLWYIHNLCRLMDLDIEKIMQNNIDKLMKRFPEKFTTDNAINRDLDAERKELEK